MKLQRRQIQVCSLPSWSRSCFLAGSRGKSTTTPGNAMGHRGNAKRLAIIKSAFCMLAAVLALTAFAANAADPIKVGMVAPQTGPGAESARYQTQGAKLAADEVNKAGGVLGRPLEFVIEDDQT